MFNFLSETFSNIFTSLKGNNRLTEKNLEEILGKLKDSLLEADIPYDLVLSFIATLKQEVLGQKVFAKMRPDEQFMKVVHDELLKILGGEFTQEAITFQIPSVVMVIGLQGSGKTTTLGKLAHYIKTQAQKRNKTRNILLASVDYYRPAAINQLEIVSKQVGVDFYRSAEASPIEAVRDIISVYKKQGYEHLLLDTAGRLHVDVAMMDELKKIYAFVQPKYTYMVLDGMTGQESLSVAKAFQEAIPFDAAILSKMDSDARGGAAFSFRYALKKPIMFMGVGEKVDQLELFRPERIAQRMLGMGDIVTLLEKAQEKIKDSEKHTLEQSLKSGSLTLDDFEKQLTMMSSMGSLASMMKYMPMGNAKVSQADLTKGERDIKRFKAVLGSMTKKEKNIPALLDGSRKKRIAQGAGVEVAVVNELLERFEESQQFVKLLKKKKFF